MAGLVLRWRIVAWQQVFWAVFADCFTRRRAAPEIAARERAGRVTAAIYKLSRAVGAPTLVSLSSAASPDTSYEDPYIDTQSQARLLRRARL